MDDTESLPDTATLKLFNEDTPDEVAGIDDMDDKLLCVKKILFVPVGDDMEAVPVKCNEVKSTLRASLVCNKSRCGRRGAAEFCCCGIELLV